MEKRCDQMLRLECAKGHIEETLSAIRRRGRNRTECVVLWLGKRVEGCVRVEEVYLPDQISTSDTFRIPPGAMRELMDHLRAMGLMVCAQIHTHPEEAFHSLADDAWAFVKHEYAISIVLPYFASRTDLKNFWEQAETYYFSSSATWRHLVGRHFDEVIKVNDE